MLSRLIISNLAVIEKAEAVFVSGFNVLTGETGAGKSILISGLNAVTGAKVSKDSVRSGADKAEVTAVFSDIPVRVRDELAQCGIECGDGDDLILTREISREGKNSARINGKIVTASVLRQTAGELADIHGQHDNRLIVEPSKQLELLDSFAGITAELSAFRETFSEFNRTAAKIRAMRKNSEIKEAKISILTEKINEIRKYSLKPGEEDEVANKLRYLRNSENIINSLSSALSVLTGYSDRPGAADMLSQANSEIRNVLSFFSQAKEISERLKTAVIETKDIAEEISSILSGAGDISELPALEERSSEFARLKRKYGLTADELCEQLGNWEKELFFLKDSDNAADLLEKKKAEIGVKLKKQAAWITAKRKNAAAAVSARLEKELSDLNMDGARITFEVRDGKITVNGGDEVEIMIAANRGETPKPLSKTASGGELSRVMLGIKTIDSSDSAVTSVFDEVDTGISGQAALKVGLKLAEISKNRQVICITHLAQIAAKADSHLLILKQSDGERTFTEVHTLDTDGRKKELSRIISGVPDDKDAAKAAEKLMNG